MSVCSPDKAQTLRNMAGLSASGAQGEQVDEEYSGHSPLGMKMMLKAGWRPGDALGRDPGM